ncbi:hypothetical protein O8B93_04515 [Agrobacterium rhizogenes]|uniref:hypothetical protein n=1 Tax=Rhizobium rhizogenes TaxID=359 RepID=UPI0022B6362F|nr:hypothetical protein [Rhizobium rhizogenes]MCZ7446853.1 hypothetical protein [Rhizobium rhizogenes]
MTDDADFVLVSHFLNRLKLSSSSAGWAKSKKSRRPCLFCFGVTIVDYIAEYPAIELTHVLLDFRQYDLCTIDYRPEFSKADLRKGEAWARNAKKIHWHFC